MSNQDNTELIEVVLGLLEKSKQQDESIQKAIKALESEKTALETLRNDFKGVVVVQTRDSVQNALERPLSRLQGHSENLQGVVRDIERAKRDLDWRANLWYFGGFAVFMACCFGFMLWFVPSLDEIGERKAELAHLTAQVEKAQNLQRLQTSNCDKRLCVKIIESKCNYGSKGDRYCVADLK